MVSAELLQVPLRGILTTLYSILIDEYRTPIYSVLVKAPAMLIYFGDSTYITLGYCICSKNVGFKDKLASCMIP
jgi:hypothetical protein